MVNLFFICGAHCCGKTTVLKKLEQDGDISFRGSEIGNDLFNERKFLTETVDEEFEFEVANLEIQRDTELINYKGVVGIETWHPGNMAYAATRNPNTILSLRETALKSPLIDHAFGVWININKNEIRKRTQLFQERVDWACEFYGKVNSKIVNCIELLTLQHRIRVIDGNRRIEAVIYDVKEFFHLVFPTNIKL